MTKAEGLAASAAGCFVLAWIANACWLPERVPLHFGTSGNPDRWGTRSEALITFGVVGLGLGLLLCGTALASDRIPGAMFNAPNKDWWLATPERETRLRAHTKKVGLHLSAATLFLIAVVEMLTLQAAHAEPPRLSGWVIPVLVIFVAVVVWVCVQARRFARTTIPE